MVLSSPFHESEKTLFPVTETVLDSIHEHTTHNLFHKGKQEKLDREIHSYLGRINTHLQTGNISKSEYLFGMAFHVFPQSLLNLPFTAEHIKFNKILENKYNIISAIYVTKDSDQTHNSKNSPDIIRYSSCDISETCNEEYDDKPPSENTVITVEASSYSEKLLTGYAQASIESL